MEHLGRKLLVKYVTARLVYTFVAWVIDELGQMAGLLLFFSCTSTKTQSRSITMEKKNERGQHPAFLSEQNWPIEEYFLAQRS